MVGWDLVLSFLIVVYFGTHHLSNLWFHAREESHRVLYMTSASILNLSGTWLPLGIPFYHFSSSAHLLSRLVSSWVAWWKMTLTWVQGIRAPLMLSRNLSGLRPVAISLHGHASNVWRVWKEVILGHGASLKVIRCLSLWVRFIVFLGHRFPQLTPKEQEHHAFFGGTSPCYHVPPGHGSQCVGSHRSPPHYRCASCPHAPPEVSDSALLLSSHDDMGKICFLIIISCQHRQNCSLGKAFYQESHSLTASVY